LAYEFSGQYLLDEREIDQGLRVIANYARLIGVLPGAPAIGYDPVVFSDDIETCEVKAPCAGLLQVDRDLLYKPVATGDEIGRVLSFAGFENHPVLSPADGFVAKLGAGRPNCDVALPPQHPFVEADETVGAVWSNYSSKDT
jgi:hypothetical protein